MSHRTIDRTTTPPQVAPQRPARFLMITAGIVVITLLAVAMAAIVSGGGAETQAVTERARITETARLQGLADAYQQQRIVSTETARLQGLAAAQGLTLTQAQAAEAARWTAMAQFHRPALAETARLTGLAEAVAAPNVEQGWEAYGARLQGLAEANGLAPTRAQQTETERWQAMADALAP